MGETTASGVSPETAGDSLFNIPRLVSRNMYYRTVVASALIRLLLLVTPAQQCACALAISKIVNYYNRDLTYMTKIYIP